MNNKETLRLLNDAWLNIDRPYHLVANPLEILRTEDPDEFHRKFTWLLMQPEYFSFICKHVFNINLLPMQALILKEMWDRKFPMLVGSRGLGKSFLLSLYAMLRALLMPERKIVIVGAAFRQSKFLYEYMKTIWDNAPVLQDICDRNSGPRGGTDLCRMIINKSTISCLPIGDGCCSGDTLTTRKNGFYTIVNNSSMVWGNNKFRNIEYTIDNGIKPTKIITTKKGFSYEGTHNHAMRVLRNGKIDWVRTDDMQIGDRILIDRSQRWHSGDFECTEDQAYTLGAMIGDGCWTNKYSLSFATLDKKIIEKVNRGFDNQLTQRSDFTHWSYSCKYNKADWLNFWGLEDKCYAKNKVLPQNILNSPQNKMTACLQGLFDTDGHVFVSSSKGGTTISVNFTNTSETLVKQLQYILLHYGIVSTVSYRDRNEKWNRVYELGIYGKNVKKFADEINFYLPRKRDKLNNAIAKRKKWNSFDDDIPVTYEQVLSVLNPKKVKCSASQLKRKKSFQLAFLQKVIDAADVKPDWAGLVNEDIFYDIVTSIEDSECHTYDIHVPDGNEYCANGFFSHNSKIRGMRANDIVADEFACLERNTLIQTEIGLIKIKDYLNGDVRSLVNIDGELEVPDKIFTTPKTDVYKITTQNGYSFKCSSIHKVLSVDGWKIAKDLTNKDKLYLDINNFFPEKKQVIKNVTLDEKLAWLMGVLVSEGTVTNRNYISIKNTDKVLIDKILDEYSEYDWKVVYKDSYKDARGWDCNESWEVKYSNTEFRTALRDMGIAYITSHEKEIPSSILTSPKSVVISFLSGLFEGDGTAFNYTDKGKKRIGVSYYSVNEELINQLQILLLKFGIISSKTTKNSKISKNTNFMLSIRGENAYKIYKLLNIIKWEGKFDNADFLVKKPTIIKRGDRLLCQTTYGNKNKHLGVFDTIEECQKAFNDFYAIARPIVKLKSVEKLPEQEVLYDFHMPKTHSFIGNGFVQHNSMHREIFEIVIAGFAAVSADPVGNVKRKAMEKYAQKHGIDLDRYLLENHKRARKKGNQIIFSGTAYYDFNHFADYWKRWKKIINSKGDRDFLKNNLFGGDFPADFNWEDYSIMRIPVDLIPEGFMDAGQVARAKATVHTGIYNMEYGAVFAKDSQGFFKRSLVESCVANEEQEIVLKDGDPPILFDPQLIGDKKSTYIMGVDPASEIDNFSIVILEVKENHRRIVHCWTTTRKQHLEKLEKKLVDQNNFYSYCARKIRDLMKVFPIDHIALDAQGGGRSIAEALHDHSLIEDNERPIWEVVDDDKEKPTDTQRGLHILEMCEFSNYKWYHEAHHGLRKDLETRKILFPRFDPITIELSIQDDKNHNRLYDTLEDCVMEIEELKNELSLIEITNTDKGRERWDTPEVKTGVGKKSRMRKDRFSSLIMANMAARQRDDVLETPKIKGYGGFAGGGTPKKKQESPPGFSSAPKWFLDQYQGY